MVEYTPRDYEFPEVYLEGIESDVYMIVNKQSKTYNICKEDCGGEIRLGRTIYEEASTHFLDIINGKIIKKTAVLVPRLDYKALYVEEGTPAKIYEASGLQTVFNLYEGDTVRPGDKLAFILTMKGETRTLRSEDEGVVFYIAWDRESYPPKYLIVIVPEDNIVILEPADQG